MPVVIPDTDQIVITASRDPEDSLRTPASVTIIDQAAIERLGSPLLPALLRLAPSTAVATSGPIGPFTEVRIRGAENNHTLLFIDGIRANDPATGDFARFELLNSDLASRVEVVRGPQSALWGSDAIGGVVAVNGTDIAAPGSLALEAGSFGFARASASGAVANDTAAIGGGVGWQRSSGIDSFGAVGGDKDGYRNLSGRIRATADLGHDVQLGAAAFALTGRTEFDGYNSLTGERTDTLDNTRNRLLAARVWVAGTPMPEWKIRAGATVLGSTNRNYLAQEPLNRTRGFRRSFDLQLQRDFYLGAINNTLIVAAESEREEFRARGLSAGLPTDQDRDRAHHALTAEWRAITDRFTLDLALRRDMFNRFKDTTTLRASGLTSLGGGFVLTAAYAEGIAQPTFFDLYGTFPGIFIGNPELKSETSRGFEGSLRFRRPALSASLTAFRQRLHDEIVDVFDLTTFRASTQNSSAVSRRWGIEAELGWQPVPFLRLRANYAYLDATQPDGVTGVQLRERRRPKHSGVIEGDGVAGRWTFGASLIYAGSHLDSQEVAPFGIVRVKPHAVVDGRVAYSVRGGIEAFARVSNLFDADYEEVAGYRTEGRGLFLGFKLADRRSSP